MRPGRFNLIFDAHGRNEDEQLIITPDRKSTEARTKSQTHNLLYLHGMPMGIAFLLLFPCGALFIRQSFAYHVAVQCSATILVAGASIKGVMFVIATPNKARKVPAQNMAPRLMFCTD
jgi:hypothetical protein